LLSWFKRNFAAKRGIAMPRLISFDYWTITRFNLDTKATTTQSPSSIVGREPTSFANKFAVARMRLGRYKRW
jgi:hypothetical protein